MPVYLQGLTMGLAYVAPIGAQNLFVINTALTRSRPRVLRGINLVCGTVMVFYGLRLLGQLPALLT